MTSPSQVARVGQHTLVYGAGIVLSKAVAFVMLPVYTSYLTPADYGILQLVQMSLEVASIFAGAAMISGVFRFHAKAETPDERQAVISTALLLFSASYGVMGIGIFLAAPWISALVFGPTDATDLIRIASGSLVFEGTLLVPLAYLQVRERSRFFVLAQVARLALQLTLNIVFLVVLRMGAKGVLLSTLLTNVCFALLMVGQLLTEVRLKWSWQASRDLFRFGFPLVGTHIATFVLTFGDRYFLQSAAGPTVVGLYALSYQFGFLLTTLVSTPFAMVWEPMRFEVAKRPDRDSVYARFFVYLNVALLTLAVVIALFVADFLRIIAKPAFYSAADIVPLILLAYVFQAWTNFLSTGVLVREKTELITVANWVAAVLVILLYAAWIPHMLGMGAALATLVAFAVRAGIAYIASQRVWPVQYQWREVVVLLGVSTLIVLAAVVIGRERLLLSLGMRLGLLVIYFGALWRLGILTDSERLQVRRFARSPRAALSVGL